MSKKLKDEMIYNELCYWDDAARSYIPYDLKQLTLRHCETIDAIIKLRKKIEGLDATIEGLNRDINQLRQKVYPPTF